MLDAAVAAARRGWAVFPCRVGGKRPAVDRWEQRACADPGRVARHWPGPRHNVGIACLPSGLVVLDLDNASHGGTLPPDWRGVPGVTDGADVLAVLADRAAQPWPATYTVRTASGGLHLYFHAAAGREIRNSAGNIGPMIDVRGAGGFVVGAGSMVRGKPYEVVDGSNPAPLPPWVADLATPPSPAPGGAMPPITGATVHGRLRGLVERVLSSQPGDRNGPLFWAACRAGEMVAAGEVDQATAERVLVAAALQAGLRGGETEARRTIASGLRRGPA
jgi:hypothetical protein